MSDRAVFLLYTLLLYGAFATIAGFAGAQGGELDAGHKLVIAFLPPLLGGAAVVVHRMIGHSAARMLKGGFHERQPEPALSKARSLIRLEQWSEAREELDRQWAAFPGHGDLVGAYERCFLDGLKAPSGFAEFLRAALPVLQGEDKAYAYWRLAELNVDHLDRKQDARLWCRRLESEFPGSPRVEQARALLAKLPAGEAAA